MGCRIKKGEKPRPCYHHFIWIFSPIPFFNPSDEVWTGRGMLSQTAISLHHMCLTHRMAGRRGRGVCREHTQEKGERKKIHDMKSRMGCSRGTLIPRDVFFLQRTLMLLQQHAHHALTITKTHPMKHVTNDTRPVRKY